MPWQEETCMSLRREFVALAKTQTVSLSELCRRFDISRPTAYKWLDRAAESTNEDFEDRSRRPSRSPTRTSPEMELVVIHLRQQHASWGGRKINKVLKERGYHHVPAPSTITHILHRHGLIQERTTGEGAVYHRFEHEKPNLLWQMDFKGYFQTQSGRCEPLTILDDHSRYNIVLHAMKTTNRIPVKQALIDVFRQYGLPYRINADNGQPWGSPSAKAHGVSQLTAWLIRLGIKISFSRPYHPQTNGKEERFHRTLKTEVLKGKYFTDLKQVQRAFDEWRVIYNHVRPHDALALDVPASRYQPSTRPYPEVLPDIEYSPDDEVVNVISNGEVRFKQRVLKVSNALTGLPIAFRQVHDQKDVYDLYFCHHSLGRVDLNQI